MTFVYPRAAVMLSPKKATVSPSWSKNPRARRFACGARQTHAPTARYKTIQLFVGRMGTALLTDSATASKQLLGEHLRRVLRCIHLSKSECNPSTLTGGAF